jgi:YD repeat-containing protein
MQRIIQMLAVWFVLMIMSTQVISRPVIEGYSANDEYGGFISKSPSVAAELRCNYYNTLPGSGGTVLVSGPENPSISNADWPHPFPQRYSLTCGIPNGNGGYTLWKYSNGVSDFGVSWRSTEGHNTNNNEPPTCNSKPKAGNPISLAYGEKIQTEDDIIPTDQSPLRFKRFYNSGATSSQSLGSFGENWTHTYDRRIIAGSLSQSKDPSILYWRLVNDLWLPVGGYSIDNALPSAEIEYAYVTRANGKNIYHERNGDSWETDYGVKSTLTLLPNEAGWLFVTADNTREAYDLAGRLVSIENARGQAQELFYEMATAEGGDDNPQTLDRVQDDAGNTLTFSYNDEGRIQTVTHSNGDVYQYSYALTRLDTVTYPNLTTRLYHYDSHNRLTGITDERGIRYVTWAYNNAGMAILSEHAGGVDRVSVDYAMGWNWLSTDGNTASATTTNPLGKQTTYYMVAQGGVPLVTQVEGHPSANCAGANKNYTYDANGFMASKTDWNNNITTYTHNDRGQELSRTEASGTPQARTITTEWHSDFNLPIRIVEPERETVMTYDANGRLLSRQVQARSN